MTAKFRVSQNPSLDLGGICVTGAGFAHRDEDATDVTIADTQPRSHFGNRIEPHFINHRHNGSVGWVFNESSEFFFGVSVACLYGGFWIIQDEAVAHFEATGGDVMPKRMHLL